MEGDVSTCIPDDTCLVVWAWGFPLMVFVFLPLAWAISTRSLPPFRPLSKMSLRLALTLGNSVMFSTITRR